MSNVEKKYQIGNVSVRKVQEQHLNGVPTSFLLPTSTPEEIDLIKNHLHAADMDDARETLNLSIHTWLLETPDHIILIDTGSGNDKERPLNPIFHHQSIPFLERLAEAGVHPDQVDYVINTHLHVDHSGWNTVLVDGNWVPTFKNARYLFPRADHEYYGSTASHNEANNHSRGVYEDSVQPVIAAGLVDFIEVDGGKLLDLLTFMPTPGHSVGHTSIILESAGEKAVFAGDIMNHPAQLLRPDFNTVFCEFSDRAQSSRLKVLNFTAENQALYCSTHFPATSAGYITKDGDLFRWTYA